MRRFLTTLAILLVVLAAGMTALVVLVNPNDFRAYMVNQVEARSGYQLRLDGELRWHVWPQLSILSGGMSLQAPGAAAPVVSAENMRLDVKLWPLLSHRLEVKQVMLKGAVLRLTPESATQRPGNAPIAPSGSSVAEDESGWRLDIERLKLADSLLIWQRDDNEQINVRDINLLMEQDGERQAHLELSGRVNRDQLDLAFSLTAGMDLRHYPYQVSAGIEQFDYRLHGAGIPADGLSGNGSMQVSYQRQPEIISVSQFALSASDSKLTGKASATLGEIPDYALELTAERLNLDALSGFVPETDGRVSIKTARPVVSAERQAPMDGRAWRAFSARVALQADTLIYRGLNIRQLRLAANNRDGVLNVATLSGELNGGRFSLPGSMNVDATPAITVRPELDAVEVAPLVKAFSLPETVSGKLTASGQLSGDTLTLASLMRQWRGNAVLQVENLRFQGVNVQQMVQMAVVRNNGGVQGQERYERYTEMARLSGKAELKAGSLRITNIRGQSALLTLSGTSQFDLPGQQCDTQLNVRVTGGWRGDERLVEALAGVEIPLRIYGPLDKLNYQLQVDQLLRKRLQDELKKRLNDWADKNRQGQNNSEVKRLLDRL